MQLQQQPALLVKAVYEDESGDSIELSSLDQIYEMGLTDLKSCELHVQVVEVQSSSRDALVQVQDDQVLSVSPDPDEVDWDDETTLNSQFSIRPSYFELSPLQCSTGLIFDKEAFSRIS